MFIVLYFAARFIAMCLVAVAGALGLLHLGCSHGAIYAIINKTVRNSQTMFFKGKSLVTAVLVNGQSDISLFKKEHQQCSFCKHR